MAYTIPEIIIWSKISQPLARIGEAKRKSFGDNSADTELDMKLYDTRADVQYAYDQSADADIQFIMGNYLLALCGRYLFQAQATTVGGGTITPIVPGTGPTPYDFVVDATSFILNGATSKTLPSNWIGFNILLVINSITQSTVDDGVTAAYSWNKTTAGLTFIHRTIATGDLIQIYPFA